MANKPALIGAKVPSKVVDGAEAMTDAGAV